MPNIGPLELIIVLAIVLLIFGPKRLPGLGRQLGRGMREFKDSVTGKDEEAEEREALPPAAPRRRRPPTRSGAPTRWTSSPRPAPSASAARTRTAWPVCGPSGTRTASASSTTSTSSAPA